MKISLVVLSLVEKHIIQQIPRGFENETTVFSGQARNDDPSFVEEKVSCKNQAAIHARSCKLMHQPGRTLQHTMFCIAQPRLRFQVL